MNTAPRILILAAALTLTGAALAGCTVRVADTKPSTSDSSASSPSAADEETEESDEPQTDTATPAASDPADDPMARLRRTLWAPRVSQHVTCVDGQYTVDENAFAAIVEVTGDCREVTIIADGGVVLLPAVDELKVLSDQALIIVESAREITIDEDVSANTIGWEKGTPIIKDAGTFTTTVPIR